MIGSTPWGYACPDLLWQPSKAERIGECWQVKLIVGGVGNGATEEDWCWDLKPGATTLPGGDHSASAQYVGTTWLGRMRDFGRKGVKGLLQVGHEKVPRGSGLTGDHSRDTADGARTEGLPEPWTSTFPEIRYPRLGKGEKEGLCVFVGILKNFRILMKTLSHYSKSI